MYHTSQWLEALRRTYGYEPVVYTTTAPGQDLENGIPFCRVNSWLTGKRLVSLPFSDHCRPLVDDPDAFQAILAEVEAECRRAGLKYAELRPFSGNPVLEAQDSYSECKRFHMHIIDLSDSIDAIHSRLHKNAVRIPIRDAGRAGLEYSIMNNEAGLKQFHRLMMVMRRKHGIPPQPISWFRNLLECLGEAMEVRIACKEGVPIASIITILHKGTIYYKYMGYDPAYVKIGAIPGLVWQAIKDLKERGAVALDFGRTDYGNTSLVEHKERWSATRSELTYWRTPVCAKKSDSSDDEEMGRAKKLFAILPDPLLRAAGNVLYKHMG
ncbi:MAG: GNAT family N-acetyltransferase [Armatimonadetes bacterium]|nr:GNAT family N-acetyltransferase [Armatimonadota bacterium]